MENKNASNFAGFAVTDQINPANPIDVMAIQRVFAVLVVGGVEMHYEDGVLYADVRQMHLTATLIKALHGTMMDMETADNG